jgi:hypothetical protein
MKLPDSLSVLNEWQNAGAELGRRNVPRRPDGDSAARAALRAILAARHRHERETYLHATETLDAQRGNLIRRIHELHAQAQTDPRQASALPTALEHKQAADMNRRQLHARFVESVNTITCQAELCDAAWREGNEAHRDRRLALEPTDFALAPDLIEPVPDPYA